MKRTKQTAWVIKDNKGRMLLDSFAATQVRAAKKAHRSGKDWRRVLAQGYSCVKVEIREL